MRILAYTVVTLTTILAAAPARAQTYDPRFPVCMHVYGGEIGEFIKCTFTSLPQCRATASGLPAQCVINPFYALVEEPTGPAYRRYRPTYY